MTARMTPTRSGSPPGPQSRAARTPAGAPVAPGRRYPVVAPEPSPPSESSPAPESVRPAPPSEPAVPPGAPPDPPSVSAPAGEHAAPVAPDLPGTGPSSPVPVARSDHRRAQRAARRHRRRLAVWCGVVVAFCFGVTILIVLMAGNRAPGPQGLPALAPSVAVGAGGGAPLAVAARGVGAPGGGRR